MSSQCRAVKPCSIQFLLLRIQVSAFSGAFRCPGGAVAGPLSAGGVVHELIIFPSYSCGVSQANSYEMSSEVIMDGVYFENVRYVCQTASETQLTRHRFTAARVSGGVRTCTLSSVLL